MVGFRRRKKGNAADLSSADLSSANLYYATISYTNGPLLVIGRQGEYSRDVILNTKLKTAQVGCFKGTFDEARKAIREKYGEKATKITGGYGLTFMAMDAIEKEGDSLLASEHEELKKDFH